MKKKISFILSLIMMFACIQLPANAKINTQDKYEVLCSLGFFNHDTVYNEKASVTCGEIVAALVNSLPEERVMTYDGENTGFSDVTSEDADYATIAYNAKILGILGTKSEFGAYKKATADDAAFMILNLLGYGGITNNSLGYASELGITKGMPKTDGFTMGGLTVMLYNALDTRVVKFGIGGDKKLAEIVDGTYLTEILKAGKVRGVVTANAFSAIDGDVPTYSDEIKIDKIRYKTLSEGQFEYIGQTVDCWYRYNDEKDREIVFIKTYNEDRILELEADKIVDYYNLQYTYYSNADKSKEKKADILISSDIIYNGKQIGPGFDKYKPDDGYVRLIDNDSDGKYEVVVIKDYTTVAVGKLNKEERTFSDMYDFSKSYTVDLYADKKTYSIRSADGETKLFSDIYINNVIFVAQSEDKELTEIIISDKSVLGSVSSYSGNEIGINGISYEYTKEFADNNDISLYTYGTFYLDPLGRVGAFKSTLTNEYHTGYLIKAVETDDSPYDDSENIILFKMYTDNGLVERIYSAKTMYYIDSNEINSTGNLSPKVKINSVTKDDFFNALSSAKDDNLGGGWLVMYKLNSKGRITEMEIAAKYNNSLTISEKLNQSGRLRQTMEKKDNITHHTGLFQMECRIGPDTKVFSIPADISNETKFECYTGVTNCFAWNKAYTITAFSKQKDGDYADVVLGYLTSGEGNADDKNVFIVESVSNGLNDEDEVVKTIEGMWGNTKSEFKLTDESSKLDIESGDILRLEFDDFGNARISGDEAGIIFDRSNPKTGKSGTDKALFCSFYGYAYDLKGTVLQACTADPDTVNTLDEITNMWADKFTGVYKFKSKNNKLEAATYTDIIGYKDDSVKYSDIFAWFRYADHQILVIYE